MIVIAVNLVVDAADADAFETRLRKHAANSLTQPGCKGFLVARDQEKAGSFHLWESYDDMDAFEEHKNAGFMADFREYSTPLVKERTLAICDLVPGGVAEHEGLVV